MRNLNKMRKARRETSKRKKRRLAKKGDGRFRKRGVK